MRAQMAVAGHGTRACPATQFTRVSSHPAPLTRGKMIGIRRIGSGLIAPRTQLKEVGLASESRGSGRGGPRHPGLALHITGVGPGHGARPQRVEVPAVAGRVTGPSTSHD
jgi:hypothetical protein